MVVADHGGVGIGRTGSDEELLARVEDGKRSGILIGVVKAQSSGAREEDGQHKGAGR